MSARDVLLVLASTLWVGGDVAPTALGDDELVRRMLRRIEELRRLERSAATTGAFFDAAARRRDRRNACGLYVAGALRAMEGLALRHPEAAQAASAEADAWRGVVSDLGGAR